MNRAQPTMELIFDWQNEEHCEQAVFSFQVGLLFSKHRSGGEGADLNEVTDVMRMLLHGEFGYSRAELMLKIRLEDVSRLARQLRYRLVGKDRILLGETPEKELGLKVLKGSSKLGNGIASLKKDQSVDELLQRKGEASANDDHDDEDKEVLDLRSRL